MKRITKLITISLFFLIFSIQNSITYNTVFSEQKTEYLRIITDDTPFFSDENGENFLFNLPYTYYVKLLGTINNLAHVELISDNFVVDGYTPKDLLFTDNLTVVNPYPSIKIKTVSNTVFYSDINLTKTIQYIFPDRKLNYYGSVVLPDETVLYYVSYNNKLGYVKEENISSFTIQIHPNELTFIKKEETVETFETTEEKKTDTTIIKIMIISCLLISGLLALFVVIKRRPQPRSTVRYYDENDYE